MKNYAKRIAKMKKLNVRNFNMLDEIYDLGMDLEDYFDYVYNGVGKVMNQEFDFLEGLEEETEQRQESTITK